MLQCVLSYLTSLTCQSWTDWMTCSTQPNAATLNMLIVIKTLSSETPPTPLAHHCGLCLNSSLSGWRSPCEIDTDTDFLCRLKLICLYTRQAGPHSAQNIATHTDFTHEPQHKTKCVNIYHLSFNIYQEIEWEKKWGFYIYIHIFLWVVSFFISP